MDQTAKTDVYLEIGKKRVFAGALGWPGWCRSGRDEAAALQALRDYGPRYARALEGAPLGFQAPAEPSALAVVERLAGDATTDFGTPGRHPSYDAAPLDEATLRRSQAILDACWRALEQAARQAAGKELRKGPRGGGRELEGIVRHVLNAEHAYLYKLGWKDRPQAFADAEQARQAAFEALAAAGRGELLQQGPRGGVMWPPRYYVRRSAWHILDHAWEIEDRAEGPHP